MVALYLQQSETALNGNTGGFVSETVCKKQQEMTTMVASYGTLSGIEGNGNNLGFISYAYLQT